MLHQTVTAKTESCSQCIKEQIIYIKTAHFGYELYCFQYQTESKTERHCIIPFFASSADDRQKKSKWRKSNDISHDIDHKQWEPKYIVIFKITADLFKKDQVIGIVPVCICSSE